MSRLVSFSAPGSPARTRRPLWAVGLALLASCNPAPTAPPARTFRIVFSQCHLTDNWRKAMLEGMRRELSFHPEVQFKTLDANNSIAVQQAQIKALTAANTDLVIVTPCQTKQMTITEAVEEVYGRGVPVVVLDQPIKSRRYSAYVGTSNASIGKTAARCAAGLLHEQGEVVEVMGWSGTAAAVNRHEGFVAGLVPYPGLRLVGSVESQWQPLTARPELEALLRAHPKAQLLFAHSDALALASWRVCRALGLEKQVRIIGVDGLPGPEGGIGLVQDGVLAASISQLPGGEEAIRLGLRILRGEPYAHENLLGMTVIDSSNVLMVRQQTERLTNQQRAIERQQGLLDRIQATYASQHLLLLELLGALLAVAGFGAVAWRAGRQQRHLNQQLAVRNEENDHINQRLTTQNGEISRQRNQLEELAAQARAETEAKLRFFTNFSHELRTPLTLIQGPVEELLTGKASLTAAQRHDLGLVRRNTQRLLALVNQLMDFRRIEVGKMPVQASEGNLVDFVREIVDVFERPALLRGIRLRWLPVAPVVSAWFDANVLDKILFNLLSNALKFTPEHGEITVRLAPGEPGGHMVNISVQDTGPGISAADQAHIFEWFYQGRVENPGTVPGSGMGLALALGMARLHHGRLTVQSTLGQGTTFELTLPRELPAALHAPGPAATTAEAAPLARLRLLPAEAAELSPEPAPPAEGPAAETLVLVIEDNPEVNDFLVRKLRPEFQVQAATDGTTGLALAIDLIPDLIVCDVMMPGLNGLEVVARLRDDWHTSHIPVVLLTARGASEQQLEGVQAGADLYLTKPFNPAFLLESVRTLLANRARQREHFRRELNLDKATVAPTRPDQRFLNDLNAIIEANLGRSELSVEDVGRSLNLSRMQLYRKVKALLGTGITEYIQGVRLAKARQLLLDDALTIAEVGYELGFTSPSYFAATFRAKYQVSPSEFRAMHPIAPS